MRHLLFLSFLLNTSCLDSEKSDTEEEENEDTELREGQTLGDCTDGIDNDEDGVTDCEDPVCFDKPACQNDTAAMDTADTAAPSDEPEFVAFSGEILNVYTGSTSENHNDCYQRTIISPAEEGSLDYPDECTGCTIFGYTADDFQTDCNSASPRTGHRTYGLNLEEGILYYDTNNEGWSMVAHPAYCNLSYHSEISSSTLTVECEADASGGALYAHRSTSASISWE